MYPYHNEIRSYIDGHRQDILDTLRRLVNLEGHYCERENVLKAMEFVRCELENEGFTCRMREVAPDRAGLLTGVLGADRPGKPVCFAGHIDTVHYTGSFGSDAPFSTDGEKAYGPGVLDMKGGVVIALAAIKALNAAGFEGCPIKVLFAGEEESDHIGNDADELITKESEGLRCAFNLEIGDIQNRLCTARKSQHTIYMSIKGVGGHAGNDFWGASNAVHEAILKAGEIMSLTDQEKDTTVTVASFHGGAHQCSIPDSCEVAFDVRVKNQEERQRIYDSVEKIMNRTFVNGTSTDYRIDAAKLAPLVETADVVALWEFVNTVARDNGYEPFGKMYRGGTTDAGNIAAAGVPVLCACGVRGGFAHNKNEYAILESLYERAAIFATAVANIDRFTL